MNRACVYLLSFRKLITRLLSKIDEKEIIIPNQHFLPDAIFGESFEAFVLLVMLYVASIGAKPNTVPLSDPVMPGGTT